MDAEGFLLARNQAIWQRNVTKIEQEMQAQEAAKNEELRRLEQAKKDLKISNETKELKIRDLALQLDNTLDRDKLVKQLALYEDRHSIPNVLKSLLTLIVIVIGTMIVARPYLISVLKSMVAE